MATTEKPTLGIDLGSTKILASVVNWRYDVLAYDVRPTPSMEGPEAVINEVIASVKSSLDQAGMSIDGIGGIGIGAPGSASSETGVVYFSPNMVGWYNVPLAKAIEDSLCQQTFLINDVNAAALGELYLGAAKGVRNFILVAIGTGIGGGIVVNGELYDGKIGAAGEIGHMTIDVHGPMCTCGNNGCWETMASGRALARDMKIKVREGAHTSVLDYVNGDVEKITARVIEDAAENGDALAQELINTTAFYFGVGLANLINIFNPELILVGGGLSHMGDRLLQPAFKTARDRSFEESYGAVRFTAVQLGRQSGALGAAIYARLKTVKQVCQ